MRGMLRSLEVSLLVPRPFFFFFFLNVHVIYAGPMGTTRPAEFEGITGPEWPSLPPSKPAKKTSSGTSLSAWSQLIQGKWQQRPQENSAAYHKSSAPPVTACVKSAGGLPHTSNELHSHQADSKPPLVSRKQLEHHPDLQPEPSQVQPSSFVSQTPSHHISESVSRVEAEDLLSQLSLAALLSKKCVLGDMVRSEVRNSVY